jgi:hypothetical protein
MHGLGTPEDLVSFYDDEMDYALFKNLKDINLN